MRRKKLVMIAMMVDLAVSQGVLFASTPAAQCESYESTKLVHPDGTTGGSFGLEVAIDGGVALISGSGRSGEGAVHVFHRDPARPHEWIHIDELAPPDAEGWIAYGISLAVSSDTAVVGADYDDANGSNAGSAYVYRDNGAFWAQEAKLAASDALSNDHFGGSVAISGDTLVIGATGAYPGSAYVFRFDGSAWLEEQILVGLSSGYGGTGFGSSVAIDGNAVLVGAPSDDSNGDDAGCAYLYRFEGSSWTQEAKLLASDGTEDARFGWSVSLSGSLAVIGSHLDPENGSESGAAYVFRHDGSFWRQEAKLMPLDAAVADRFGGSVAISGSTVVVGAQWSNVDGQDTGAAYVFRHTTDGWLQTAKLVASDGTDGDWFGNAVSVSGDTAVVGSLRLSGEQDAAYIFDEVSHCVECTRDDECDDDVFCTGAESCIDGVCHAASDPCSGSEVCNESTRACQSFDALWVNAANQRDPLADGSADHPFGSLQEAIDIPLYGIEIWVVAGTYKPTLVLDASEPRSATFRLRDSAAVYGGFMGGETRRDERDPTANLTVLTGDLNSDDAFRVGGTSDNAFHVVTGSGTSSTAVLDGFTITSGNGNTGAGMLNVRGSPTIVNCVFRGNSADSCGGGVYNGAGSGPFFADCSFTNNVAEDGGAMCNWRSSPTLQNCVFSSNSASNSAGALLNSSGSKATLTACIFEDNVAESGEGGAIHNGESDPTFEDCTLTRNAADDEGGGMANRDSSPTLKRCVFDGNSAADGGGIANYYHAPQLVACSFSGNQASFDGGAMYNFGTSAAAVGCVFEDNSAESGWGGAVANVLNNDDVPPVFAQCTFDGNTTGTFGGAIYNELADTQIENCVMRGNSAMFGGGVFNTGSDATLTSCVISGNVADDSGGGVINHSHTPVLPPLPDDPYGFIEILPPQGSQPTLMNCTIVGNYAGREGGGLMSLTGSVHVVENSILWGNRVGDNVGVWSQIALGSGGARYSCIQDAEVGDGLVLWPGNGNIDEDPVFITAGRWEDQGTLDDSSDDTWVDGDYQLEAGSPCIDAGNPDGDHSGETDVAGNARVAGVRVDMGAAEYQLIADCDSNGIEDAIEPDTDGDGLIDSCDNCPLAYNPEQADGDGNGLGDACENDGGLGGEGEGTVEADVDATDGIDTESAPEESQSSQRTFCGAVGMINLFAMVVGLTSMRRRLPAR